MAYEWQSHLPPDAPIRAPLEAVTERLTGCPRPVAEAVVAAAGPLAEPPDDPPVDPGVLAWMLDVADDPRVEQAQLTLSQLAVSQAVRLAQARGAASTTLAHVLEALQGLPALSGDASGPEAPGGPPAREGPHGQTLDQ